MVDSLDRSSLIDAAWDGTSDQDAPTPPATHLDPQTALATAAALFEEGRFEDAWELAEHARSALASVDPLLQTDALYLLAQVAQARGFLRVGEERVARAISERTDLAEGTVPLAWYELHASLANANGEHTTAVSSWEVATRVARSVRDATGEGTERLCLALRALGDALLARGDSAGSRKVLAELVTEARALAANVPDFGAVRHLTSALHRMGDACHADNDLPAAINAYRDAVREAKRVAAASDDAPEALWDVSVGLNRLGGVQLEAEQAQAAIASFEQSVDARRTFAEKTGRSPQSLSALASSLSKLSAALSADGDEAGATEAAAEANDLDLEAAIEHNHHALTMVPPPAR